MNQRAINNQILVGYVIWAALFLFNFQAKQQQQQ